MRLSLLPGLIENLRLNLAQKAESFHAFHLGKVFCAGVDGGSEERQCLAGVMAGPRKRLGLRLGEAAPAQFLDAKGIVEGVLELLHIEAAVDWPVETIGFLHPGRSAGLQVAGVKAGRLGQVHPQYCDEFGIPPSVAFELDFERLLQYAPRKITSRSLPRFPSVERDLAVVVDRAFPSRQIIDCIKNRGETLVEAATVFDQ